jgi:co-chaperonin GroES (HSP10)
MMKTMTERPQTIWTPAGELGIAPVPPEARANHVPEKLDTPTEEKPNATQLPAPSGYRILCMVPEVDRAFGSGLQKADETIRNEELLSTVLFVIKLGPDCYQDKTKFPTGPWCKEGDFVLVRPMTGSRVKIHGREFRLINDDSVDAVVSDPRGISRAF